MQYMKVTQFKYWVETTVINTTYMLSCFLAIVEIDIILIYIYLAWKFPQKLLTFICLSFGAILEAETNLNSIVVENILTDDLC